MLPVTVVCIPVAAPTLSFDLTPLLDGQPTYTTAAVGGFADATFSLRGDQRRLVPYLALVRIMLDTTVLWEGQVEDVDPSGEGESLTTAVTCFGLRRLLEENSMRRIWSKRDIQWNEPPGGIGGVMLNGSGFTKGDVTVSIGQFDPTNLSSVGVRIAGNGAAVGTNAGGAAVFGVQGGMTVVRIMGTLAVTTWQPQLLWSSTGTGAWASSGALAAGAFNVATGRRFTAVIATLVSPLTMLATDVADFSDMRLLGTSVVEDASGGFFGGTILNDLVALIPGLTIGIIEDGSDFTIEAIEQGIRDTALAAVTQVASYYTREWAVWETDRPGVGRFDWKTRQLDQPDWIVTTADCSALSIQGSLDGTARTVYVLYTDAGSGLEAETSAALTAATAPRNPYAQQGRAKDMLIKPGFPMTTNTATQLAQRIRDDIGKWVPVSGSITLPATTIVNRLFGSNAPAATIRAGDNIQIADLPKTDLFGQGRDGETLFHVVGTSCDLAAGKITLELEGQSTRTDVLLARLAAVTRTLTG